MFILPHHQRERERERERERCKINKRDIRNELQREKTRGTDLTVETTEIKKCSIYELKTEDVINGAADLRLYFRYY